MEWFDRISSALARPDVRAVLVALVISWNGTQLVKSCPSLTRLPDIRRRAFTRLIAFALGAMPAMALWPGTPTERLSIALAVGLAAPAIYAYGARALYHYFPWLEPKMSAKP